MIQFLLDNTSPKDLRIKDAEGKTPLDVAEAREFNGIAANFRTALRNATGTKEKLVVGEENGSPMESNKR